MFRDSILVAALLGSVSCATAGAPGALFTMVRDHELWLERQADPETYLGPHAPPCPCHFAKGDPVPTGWRVDSRAALVFHPGSTHGLRSDPLPSGAGVQCRYDSSGRLITSGSAAGSVDRITPAKGEGLAAIRGHLIADVAPACRAFAIAMALGNTASITEYFRARPARPGKCATLHLDPLPRVYPPACGAWPL